MKKIQLVCLLLIMPFTATAEEPLPFKAEYKVRFLGGFVARAELILEAAKQDSFTMSSYARLRLLGKSLTTVNVKGDFIWQGEKVVPQHYEYSQTGLGRTNRSIVYDWKNKNALTVVEENKLMLSLDVEMLDELSMYIEIQQQAAAGVEDIYVNVIDEDTIKEYHYKFEKEELLETKLGVFNTVKYIRVRDVDSKKKTELWLAKDWNYLVLEFHQSSPIRTFKLKLEEATVDNTVVVAFDSEDIE